MNAYSLDTYSPSELILARSEAFAQSDFGFIFDTYHSESNFRRQFVEREDYLAYGKSNLGQDYRITRCQVLQSQENEEEAQVIFLMEMKVRGVMQLFVELAWLLREKNAWRYHRGQKVTQDELPEDPHFMDFADFAKRDPMTIF